MEEYRIIRINDGFSQNTIRFIMLNNKHSLEDFEKEIDTAIELEKENIITYGDDWEFIKTHLDKFDFIEIIDSGECVYI